MIVLSENVSGATRAVTRHQPRTEGIHLRRRSGRQFIDLVLSWSRSYSTSVDRRRLRGRQACPPAFVPCQNHSAAGDGDDPRERPRVGKRPEYQPSCQRRPQQLHISEGGDRRDRRTLKCEDEKKMAQGADRTDGDEHRYVGGWKPGVVVQERDQCRHEDRAHQRRKKSSTIEFSPASLRVRIWKVAYSVAAASASSDAGVSISLPGRTISSMPIKPAITKAQRGIVMRSCRNAAAIRVTIIGVE